MKILIQKLDEVNKNGRVYPTAAIQEALAKNGDKEVLGTIGYPSGAAYIQDFSGIPLAEVSHSVKNLRIEDGYLVGDLTVLQTPKGNVLKELLEGGNVAFRTNGYGNVDADGNVKDYTLISVSMVPADTAA